MNVAKSIYPNGYTKYDKRTRQIRAMSKDIQLEHIVILLLIGIFSDISPKLKQRHIP